MLLYQVELERVLAAIQATKAKTICLQLPDGMKIQAQEIADELERKTKVRVLIWLGSNFGACDLPLGLQQLGVDLLVSWGHNVFHKREAGW